MNMSERNRHQSSNGLETVGWTPLIHLDKVTAGINTPVYGKAEPFNGSRFEQCGLLAEG